MRTAAVVIGATLAIASPNPLKAETMISPDQMTEYTCAASENRLAMVEALQIRIVWVVESLAKGQKLTGNLDPADYLLRTPMTLDYNRGGIYFWNKQHPVDPANSEGVVVVQWLINGLDIAGDRLAWLLYDMQAAREMIGKTDRMLKKTYTHDGGIFARNPPEEPNEKIEQECMNALGEEARKTSMPNSLWDVSMTRRALAKVRDILARLRANK